MSPRRRPLLWGLLALLVAGAAAGAYAWVKSRTGDVRNDDAEFVKEPDRPRPKPGTDTFSWPILGRTPDRRRFFAAPDTLRPPFRQVWRIPGRVLLEFPPVIEKGFLYQLTDSGIVRKIDKQTGRIRWRKRMGALAAASPAVAGDGRVYVTLLERLGGGGRGLVAALDQRDGRTIWVRPMSSRTESSPVIENGLLFYGTEGGTFFALRTKDGSTRWTYQAGGEIKGGAALVGGVLYFGDYSGRVHAISSRSGNRRWATGTSGARFGTGAGRFYATPAVAYGRVYLGNTDSRMYSFVARTGELAWASDTGGYVYASPAVANVPGLGPTVFVGSYDGTFYAYNARSGNVRWSHGAGSPISGGSTVIGKIVYFATLQDTATTGLDTRTGRVVWRFHDGKFDPAISDGQRLYIDGYRDLYAFEPRNRPRPAPARPSGN
jgi:outer membrane protein assembly factor BamB